MKEEEIKKFFSNLNGDSDEALYGARPGASKASNKALVIKKVKFQPFKQGSGGGFMKTSLLHLENVRVNVKAVLGSNTMQVREFLNVDEGSLIQLNTLIGENAEVFINEQKFAKGEVIVINDKFAIRITDINRLPNLKDMEEA